MVLALWLSASSMEPRTITPQFIDCSTYAQPCTGTECADGWRTYICDGSECECQNDAQNYTGDQDSICCTKRYTCAVCQKPDGTSYRIFEYIAQEAWCEPNPY